MPPLSQKVDRNSKVFASQLPMIPPCVQNPGEAHGCLPEIDSKWIKIYNGFVTQSIGRYEIVEEIGRGAMGVVYLAKDAMIDREVAVKTLRNNVLLEDFHGEQNLMRFYQEAKAAGKLSHPGIVTIFDVGKDPDQDIHYILMEYVKGEDLGKRLKKNDHPFPPEEVVNLGIQICSALQYAHAAGVVHRDVKPSNLILTPDNRVVITDFGIAKLPRSNITWEGEAIGTPSYMSPEQIKGKPVDGRSDLFSLGIVCYELLTGSLPFEGEDLYTTTYKICNEPHPPLSTTGAEIPERMVRIIDRALEKEPEDRYQNAAEMESALVALKRGDPGEPASVPDKEGALRGIRATRSMAIQKIAENPVLHPLADEVKPRRFLWITGTLLLLVALIVLGIVRYVKKETLYAKLSDQASTGSEKIREKFPTMLNKARQIETFVANGVGYLKENQLQKAEKEFKKALVYDPENQVAKEKLSEIKNLLTARHSEHFESRVAFSLRSTVGEGTLMIHVDDQVAYRTEFSLYEKIVGLIKKKKNFKQGTLQGALFLPGGRHNVEVYVTGEKKRYGHVNARAAKNLKIRRDHAYRWDLTLDGSKNRLTFSSEEIEP